jgi:L-ascorbate metabolism protein UlaG (beta-lactamase superfamily)
VKFRRLFPLLLLLVLVATGPARSAERLSMPTPPTAAAWHLAHGFRNLSSTYDYTVGARLKHLLRGTLHGYPARGPLPALVANDGAALRANTSQPTLTWIGHATFLVQLDGANILTDPHWGNRASPLGFVGPKRLVRPGLAFGNLPHIDAVIISHDHYDHLDAATVAHLAREHHPTFFVPLGLKAWFSKLGIEDVVELDWWQARTFHGITVTCTPAQHSSGRTLADYDERLWSSWVLAGTSKRLFFAGDTGYDPTLKEIGRRYGPFDVAALPIGGYSAYEGRHPNHLNPEEAIQLFEDVHARLLVPMHWGTFELNREPFREPPDRLMKEALRRDLEEHVALLSPGQTIPW